MAHVFTDANFEAEVLKSPVPVLVDFWAPWCGPCQRMTPIIEEMSTSVGTQFKIGKMNVDENQTIPGNLGIMSIPTLIIFKGGQPVSQMVGLHPKEAIMDKLKAA